ncbi:MAG: sensor histidine kinase [Polyangiales bacterium]
MSPSRKRQESTELPSIQDVGEPSNIDISMGDISRLEEVVDRDALRDVCHSFFDLFGLSIRIYSSTGSLLANVHEQPEVYKYVDAFAGGRRAVAHTVEAVKRLKPKKEVERFTCFSGAIYDVLPLTYQGRTVGRIVVGPYLPAELKEVPKTLTRVDPDVDRELARDALAKMARVRGETIERIVAHLRRIVDLLLFSSHRAHLTSEMHVASVRASYRELAEKTVSLQGAYERLKELDQLKSNFLATVSHELRTPLTSIIGYSEMLESGIAGDLESEQREFVETIRTKGEQLLALITSLLDLSKLEQGVLRIEATPLNVAAIVDDIAKTFHPHAVKKGVEIVSHVGDDLPAVMGDAMRMKQVLSNLAENAIKFTPAGGTVTFSAEAREVEDEDGLGAALMSEPRQGVAFLVRDSGQGMPKDELPRIFDAFYQVDGGSTREHGGTGLGLSIVKRLVDAHHGTITVDSELGKGTEFVVLIPEPEED